MPLIKKVQIGRIVHYVQKVDTQDDTSSPNVNPAMVVRVYDNHVCDLAVFHGNGMYFAKKINQGGHEERQTWHWPRLLEDVNG